MTMHLSTNKDSGQAYCNAVNTEGKGIGMTTHPDWADCLSCLKAALRQSQSGLRVIKGVLAEALPD